MKKLALMMKWGLVWCLFIMPFQGIHAQLIAWQFGTPASGGNEVVYLSTSTEIGMAGSLLTRGNGINIPASLSRGFGGTGFATGGTKNEAEVNQVYYQFTVATQAGYKMSLSTLDAVLRRSSASAPNTYCWKYSTDGTNFMQIGVNDISFTNTDAEGIAQVQLDLSGIGALQNVPETTVLTFRLYAWGASSTAATLGIGKTPSSSTLPSLAIGGTVTPSVLTPVIAFDFNGASGNETSIDATTAQAGLYTATLSRGNGIGDGVSTYARSFYTNNFTIGGDKANALSNNEYLQTTINVANGYKISLSSIDVKLRRSSGGPNSYRWYYSIDGNNFNEIGTTDFPYTSLADGSDGLVHPKVKLSDIASLQNLGAQTTVTLRLYLWGATSNTGSLAVGRYPSVNTTSSLVIGGSIEQEPTLVAWQFSNPASTGNEISFDATTNNINLSTSVLTRSNSLSTSSTLARGFYISGYTGSVENPGTKQDAIDNEYYITFPLAANGNKYISLSNINTRLRRSATGPTGYRWYYSTNGVDFIEIGTADIIFMGDAAGDGVIQPTVDLSGIAALQNVIPGTTITFRLYAWGATSNSGTFFIGRYPLGYATNSLMVGGTVMDAPLPVKLSKFNAIRKVNTVMLSWRTLSELNVDNFEIERSQDGQHYTRIATVKATNIAEGSSYNYIDKDAFSVLVYYRLKTWDQDGSFSYSEISYVKGLLQEQLSVYPNPVDKWLTIRHAPIIGNGLLTVTDINGNRLIAHSIVQNISQSIVDVGRLASGIYLLKIQNNNEVTGVGKFIKQ